MPLTRKEFTGGAPATTLASGIDDSTTALTLTSGTGYPTGGTYPFVLTLGRGTASEEKVLCESRSGAAVTVTTRGYDSTVAVSHASGTTVEHTIDAVLLNELVARSYDPDGTFLEASGQTIRIKDLGVTTAKVNDLAVTAGKIAADAVTTAKILDLNVTTGKLAADAVTTAKIADDNVTLAKLAADALAIIPKIEKGTYTGDGTTDRSIPVSFTPSLVYLVNETDLRIFISALSTAGSLGIRFELASGITAGAIRTGVSNAERPMPAFESFTVSGNGTGDTNNNGSTYRWIAWGT